MSNRSIAPGVYQHYKGKKYFVLGLTRHSETEEICVVYRPLYDSEWPHLFHRPLTMFCEDVEIDGQVLPRFRFVAG